MRKIPKPTNGYSSFHKYYLDLVPDDGEVLLHLEAIQGETVHLLGALTQNQLCYRYDDGKWTIKDITLHLVDCERIFLYRALCCARGDKTDLPGFDEALFASNANANDRDIKDILEELQTCRTASILFFNTLDEAALNRASTANSYSISTALIANHIYGHHLHHLNIIKERYLK